MVKLFAKNIFIQAITKNTNNGFDSGLSGAHVYFIDKFFVPKNSAQDFKKQMHYIRNFLKSLPGLIRSYAMEQANADGDLIIITVAIWENAEFVKNAKPQWKRNIREQILTELHFMIA